MTGVDHGRVILLSRRCRPERRREDEARQANRQGRQSGAGETNVRQSEAGQPKAGQPEAGQPDVRQSEAGQSQVREADAGHTAGFDLGQEKAQDFGGQAGARAHAADCRCGDVERQRARRGANGREVRQDRGVNDSVPARAADQVGEVAADRDVGTNLG